MECCFKGCFSSDEKFLPLNVALLDDTILVLHTHEQCFTSRCHPGITFDDPKENGHIPKNAKCIFCGEKLPIIGHHPFCFDFGDFVPSCRYWAHSQCLKAMIHTENWTLKTDD